MSIEDNKAAVRRFFAAMNAGDGAAIADAYAEDGEVWTMGRTLISGRFGREQTVYDPWHYVPVLAKKPGALRNGAPFKQLALPPALERLRGKLKGSDDGDRQMVKILTAATVDGLDALEAAAAEALAQGVTVRTGLSSRDAGDGVRRPCPGVRLLRRRADAGYLR